MKKVDIRFKALIFQRLSDTTQFCGVYEQNNLGKRKVTCWGFLLRGRCFAFAIQELPSEEAN